MDFEKFFIIMQTFLEDWLLHHQSHMVGEIITPSSLAKVAPGCVAVAPTWVKEALGRATFLFSCNIFNKNDIELKMIKC